MRVLELWRYPVKSMQGERLAEADVGAEGIVGDRGWALFDLDTGLGLTARRVPDLLFAAGRLLPDGGVEVVLPDGTVTADDAVLSAWLGRRVALRQADTVSGPRYESPDDDETADDETADDETAGDEGRTDGNSTDGMPAASRWHEWQGGAGAFHDIARARVSLISTGTLGAWDRRRFRSNVLLDGSGEGGLAGSRVVIGGVVLDVNDPISRCVMVTRPQPGGIGRDTSVLKTVHREHGGDLAIGALVHTAGLLRTGDHLTQA